MNIENSAFEFVGYNWVEEAFKDKELAGLCSGIE